MIPTLQTYNDQINILGKITDPIFFVCNDPLWALGMEHLLPNYHIVCIDDKDSIDDLQAQGISVFCLERALKEHNSIFRNTTKLLQHPLTQRFIAEKSLQKTPIIMPFKPSASLDVACTNLGYKLASAKWQLNKFFEDKLLFPEFLFSHNLPTVPYLLTTLTIDAYEPIAAKFKAPFVLQSGFGFAGSGTFLIHAKTDWDNHVNEMEGKKVKVSRFIKGIPVTINACATRHGTLYSPACLQITGLPEYTTSWGGTCGTSWDIDIDDQVSQKIYSSTKTIGDQMYKQGFRGIFGLDFIIEEGTQEIYIVENNARIVASIPFYTGIQEKENQPFLLAYHLLEVLEIPYQADSNLVREQLATQVKGSQLILRNVWGKPITIDSYCKSGLYQLSKEHNLAWKKPAHSVAECDKEQLIVLPTDKGRIVNPAVEYLRLRTYKPFLNKDLSLRPWVHSIVNSLQKLLGIQ